MSRVEARLPIRIPEGPIRAYLFPILVGVVGAITFFSMAGSANDVYEHLQHQQDAFDKDTLGLGKFFGTVKEVPSTQLHAAHELAATRYKVATGFSIFTAVITSLAAFRQNQYSKKPA